MTTHARQLLARRSVSRVKEPPPSISPQHRYKLTVLAVLASIVIILVWVATLPLNILRSHEDEQSTPGPQAVFGALRDSISDGKDTFTSFED